ncbi:hypothetical protein LNJ08_04205 [Tenacibaculum finnmarkense genomovar ulcerans]|uniref:hypothetical protein n=1 Tax=Tenacibaculum finnmarkense TaxID=2781243 RepID=UPI001E351812|nr:hypothetical protein [Tenacibaculum finnmarkense]MCD8453586.1 hypothetical protein [Tenacibaculum finnmarkense genomovar ulcerans]
MSNNKTHIEKTGAETKSIGFDFQYYFFLWKLLTLNKGESVGLEVKDDVHTELKNDINIFYQVKHSIQKNKEGDIKNMTASDIDLWKTLYNWAKVISDKNDNRKEIKLQLKFIEKSYFVMWSNKNLSSTNQIIDNIEKLKNNSISIDKFIRNILKFKEKSKDEIIQNYITELLSLNNNVLHQYILKISFELGEDEILQNCKDAIEAKMIPENQIDDVFAKIDSRIKEDNFIAIKSGNKIQISFEDFQKKYRKYFNVTRDNSLQIKPLNISLPDKFEEQTFIKQLLEINDIEIDDVESMARFTGFKMKLESNLIDWHIKGLITTDEIKNYRDDAILQWQNKFNRLTRKTNFNSLDLIDDLREIKLSIDGQILDISLSNGEFYYLSDIPDIGWKKDWLKHKK